MAARKRLKKQIVEALLASNKNNCLTTGVLHDVLKKKNVKCTRQELKQALEEQCKDGEVEREDENRYCLIKKREKKKTEERKEEKKPVIKTPPIPPILVGILTHLSQATKPVSTGELAQGLDLSTRQVYAICRRFEKKGYLASEVKPSEKRVFFAPLTGEVVHARNYDRVDTLYKKLGGIVAQFSPGDPKMKQSLQGFFGDMLRKEEYAKRRKSINTFRKSLLRTVSRAEKKSDVDKIMGLRPFHPKVRIWESAVG